MVPTLTRIGVESHIMGMGKMRFCLVPSKLRVDVFENVWQIDSVDE